VALKTLQEPLSHILSDLPKAIQELPPEGHVLKSTVDHVSRREVGDRKQATIRIEIVQPRRPDHPLGQAQASVHMLEEGAS
jgi:hypothetical protein